MRFDNREDLIGFLEHIGDNNTRKELEFYTDQIIEMFEMNLEELLYKYLEYKELRYSQIPFKMDYIQHGEYVIVSENKIIETFLEQLEQ